MKNGKLLAEAISTLMFSWGGDTPPVSFWTLKELIDFINAEFGLNLPQLKGEEFDKADCDTFDNDIIGVLQSNRCN